MRIIKKRRGYFNGTHKGAEIEIERDNGLLGRSFYIRVTWKDGCYIYDGWAPEAVTTMAAAKLEAIRGAML